MDLLGSGSGARNIAGLGMPAATDSAELALSTMHPVVVERTAVRKLLLAASTLNGMMPLINGHTPDEMIAFVNAPVDEVHPELSEGTADARERRDIKRREYTIAVKKSNAQYQLALAKKQLIAEILVQRVLETRSGSKLRVMQAARRFTSLP
jgi:hypothetical protein